VELHTGSGPHRATDLYWGQGSHVWNNTGTENAYLVDANGAEVTKKSCR
jgi:competence protein ComEC